MKLKKEEVVYMVYNYSNDGFWEVYDSLKAAQDSNPDGAVIYCGNIKAIGKTQSVLVEIKK